MRPASSCEIAHARRPERQRAADVVVGERRRSASADRGPWRSRCPCRSATPRGADRRTGSAGSMPARRPSYDARSVPSAIAIETSASESVPLNSVGARQAAAAGQRQRRRRSCRRRRRGNVRTSCRRSAAPAASRRRALRRSGAGRCRRSRRRPRSAAAAAPCRSTPTVPSPTVAPRNVGAARRSRGRR